MPSPPARSQLAAHRLREKQSLRDEAATLHGQLKQNELERQHGDEEEAEPESSDSSASGVPITQAGDLDIHELKDCNF